MLGDDVLVNADDVGEEGQGLYLCAHEVNEDFLVKAGRCTMLRTWLKGYCRHDQRNEIRDILMDVLLVDLVHENDDYRKLLQDFQRKHGFWNEIVLEFKKIKMNI